MHLVSFFDMQEKLKDSARAIAYSIVVLAISGITFGIIWARTKNLFALMLIHAAGDLLPNLARCPNVVLKHDGTCSLLRHSRYRFAIGQMSDAHAGEHRGIFADERA